MKGHVSTMDENYMISVIVPVYKVPFEYLDQCIDSIVNQTYQDIEIIIVDDGSPKRWADKCDTYANLDKRIKVIHKPNGGLSDARNAGLHESAGEWVTFIDGDDWVENNFIELFINRIKGKSKEELSDIYYFSGYRNFPSKEIMGKPYFEEGKIFKTYNERETLQMKCLTNHIAKDGNIKGITISSAWSKVYNTKFLKDNNLFFPIVPYDEDSLFYLEAIEKANSIEYVGLPVHHYRYNSDSITTKFRPASDKEQEIYLNHIFNFANKNNKSQNFKDKINMRVMTQMLVIVSLKFFHPQNPDSLLKRYIDCYKVLRNHPYSTALKNLNPKEMRRNPKIKYYLLKLHLYGLIQAGKNKNKKKILSK